MDDTTKAIVAGMIRHGLTLIGGALVTKGYMDSGMTAQFVGGGMALVGVAWSWWQKDGQARVVAILASMHPVVSPTASQAEAVKAANIAVKAEEAK